MLIPDDLKDLEPHELAYLCIFQSACVSWMVYRMLSPRELKKGEKGFAAEDFMIHLAPSKKAISKKVEELKEKIREIYTDKPIVVEEKK